MNPAAHARLLTLPGIQAPACPSRYASGTRAEVRSSAMPGVLSPAEGLPVAIGPAERLSAATLDGLGDDQYARRWPHGKIKGTMPTDLTVILEHQPGELARLAEITGEAGVSIRGLAAFTGEGRGVVHLLLDDQAVARCREALERAGMGIADQREVLVVNIEDRPGALGELTRQLAEANVNIELAYTTFGGVKVVIATDDLASARAALP